MRFKDQVVIVTGAAPGRGHDPERNTGGDFRGRIGPPAHAARAEFLVSQVHVGLGTPRPGPPL